MFRSRSNIFFDLYNQPYDGDIRLKLYKSTKTSLEMVQRLSLLKKLKIHQGCVNSICWNENGNLLLSGSDDQHLVITNPYNYQVLSDYKTSHKANIFSAKFLPDNSDHRIVSCSGDGTILYTDLLKQQETLHNQFNCHSGTTYEIATIPSEPQCFLSCGEDGTVRLFDLRIKEKCSNLRCKEDILILCERAVTAISVNPKAHFEVAIGCADGNVRTYDRRVLGTPATGWTKDMSSIKPTRIFAVPELGGNSYRITSLSYSSDGQDVLVSYSSDHIYLFSVKENKYTKLTKKLKSEVSCNSKNQNKSPQTVRRLRLRGDWSDTGPEARPEGERGNSNGPEIAQARPTLHQSLMQRMTDALSRMLNDPATRVALSGGGEDSREGRVRRHGDGNQYNEIVNESANAERHNNSDDSGHNSSVQSENVGDLYNLLEVNSSSTNQSDRENSATEEVPETTETLNVNVNSEQLPVNSSGSEAHYSQDSEHQNVEHNQSDENSISENMAESLALLRNTFLGRQGTESVTGWAYSDDSSTNSANTTGICSDTFQSSNTEESYSNFCDNSISNPGPSSSNVSNQINPTANEPPSGEDFYIDSDDEDSNVRTSRIASSKGTKITKADDSSESLENYGISTSEYSNLFVKQKYVGHRNARTMIKEANFWGDDFVMSGSDCGHVFVWDRETAKLCMLLEADQHVVNCLQPHPFLPILATSGIDYDVKLWAPINEESVFDEQFADDLKKRNAVMLEETKDTVTVPAVFMIRILACLNQIRRGRGQLRRRTNEEDSNEVEGE